MAGITEQEWRQDLSKRLERIEKKLDEGLPSLRERIAKVEVKTWFITGAGSAAISIAIKIFFS